jgi:hypothetical protein
MTTQVIVNVDKNLKIQAMKKAKREGIPFSAVLKLAIKAFVDGHLNVGFIGDERFNAATRSDIGGVRRDIAKGKNLSPRFSSARSAIYYLNK